MGKEVIDSVSRLTQEDQEIKTTLTPELIERLAQYLKIKHGLDINKAIFQITREEINTIKLELKSAQNPEYVWQQFFDKEAIELSLRDGGISAIDIEKVTFGIESSRMDYVKREFDKIIVPYLDKYDFLDKNTKNILKLAIANRLLSNPIAGEIKGTLENVGELVKGFADKTNAQTQAEADKSKEVGTKTSNEIESKILPILEEYSTIFESISQRFNQEGGNITVEQKQAVISNVPFFRSPNLMEKGTSAFDISAVDLSKRNINNNFDLEEVKQYIYDSRKNIEKMASLFQSGDQTSELVYTLMNSGDLMKGAIKGFLEVMLMIPIFGKFIAIFLGLDPENPLKDLEESAELYKFFGGFISLGRTPENKEGKGVLKHFDLKEVNFNVLKKDIKAIKAIVPNLKPEDYNTFWEKAFDEGINTEDGFNIKFELSSDQKGKTKLNTSDVKEIFKVTLEKYEIHKSEKKLKEEEQSRISKQQEIESRTATTRASLESLQLRLSGINKITTQSYKDMDHWDDWFNIGDINDVELSSVIANTSGDFGSLIGKEIGEEEYAKLSQEDKDFLNQFFSYIKEYISSKPGFKIEFDVKNFLKKEKEFFDFVKSKKEALEKEREKVDRELGTLNQENVNLELQNKLKSKLESITEETILSNGIDIGDNVKIVFDKEKQELRIGENVYKVSITSVAPEAFIEDIKIIGENVEFIPGSTSIFGRTMIEANKNSGLVNKKLAINGIIQLLTTGTFKYEGKFATLNITKGNKGSK